MVADRSETALSISPQHSSSSSRSSVTVGLGAVSPATGLAFAARTRATRLSTFNKIAGRPLGQFRLLPPQLAHVGT